MDGYIVGSMISANSIVGEQIQANSIKTANLELSVQKKIQDATNEETVKALIKADLDGFESTLSKEFVTVENATTQIQQATEVAVKEATQSIIDNAVTESMGAVDGQLNDKLNQYTSGTLLPAINEKAEEVLQNAEDYVVTQLESYATKQELSSSISQTREQIELSVSEKYTTKTESATIITEAIDGITVGAINRALGTGENKSFKFNGGANETWLPYKFSNDISDKEAYVSFNYTLTGTAQNGSQIEFAPSYLKKTNNKTVYQPKNIFFASDRLQDVNISDTLSFVTRDFKDISPSSTSYIRFVGNGFTGTLSISEVQIKPGNSKTSWSPAPEDVNNDIVNAKNEAIISANNTLISTIANHYTKSETDSKISVAKNEINLGVSNTYETKTNVETKVASTLNSAKSYSDTKKTEAINAAATDATNKVNSAKTELNTAIGKKANSVDVYTKSEVYTKAQTDSAIKVAKDEINLGVSNTYETKANVETKINNISVGGRNYVRDYMFRKQDVWKRNRTSESFIDTDNGYGYLTSSTANPWLYQIMPFNVFKKGQVVTIQYEIKCEDVSKNTSSDSMLIRTQLTGYESDSGGYIKDVCILGTHENEVANLTSWTKKTITGTIGDIGAAKSIRLRLYARNFTGKIYFRNVKLELGTKATDLSPAPEDTITDITNAKNDAIDSANGTLMTTIANYYTKSETDSAISVAKDEINLGVSNKYETKTNVATKVTSTLNSAKSYADTKKTEAINSANSTLSTTIQNYYTKTETNSQINIAKNAVTTSVSNLRSEVMSATYTNLLENSDFLILDSGFPRGYSRYTIDSNTSVSMSGWSLDGGKAVRITSAGQTDNVWIAMFSPFVKAYKGETFTASVFITTNDYTAIDNQVAVEIEWYSDSGRIGTSAHFFTKTYNGWERQSVTGTAPDGTTKARMRVHVVKNGTIYVTKMMLQTGGILTNWVKGGNIDSVTERLASAEQKITDESITSTVKQNFYTKTETDGKVTTVQNSMNSSITQLSNQIATKVDVNGVKSTIEQNPSSVQIGFNKISNALTVSPNGLIAKTQSGNTYFQLGYNGMTMYNPANGTHQWGKVAAINNKFTVASNGNSSGLSLGHHVNDNYVEDILCNSNGVVSVQRQINHNGVFYNNYGQMFVRQSGQGGWEITGRSDSQSIKPGGANQGGIGSNTQYINQSWIANRYNPSSLEIKYLSHYVDDLECLKLVSEVQPARYFYKEYDENGNDITTFTTKTSQLGLIYEDVRECSGRDLLTNEEDKAINSYGMVSVLWGAVRNLNERLNKLEYENALLNDELQNYKQKEGND